MNQVTLIGRLTRDPELRELKDGRPVCNMRVAVEDRGRGGERGPTYVSVSSFGAAAKACAAHLAKGAQVAVSGRLVFREWNAKDGSWRSELSVWGNVEFLGSRPARGVSVDGESDRDSLLAPLGG